MKLVENSDSTGGTVGGILAALFSATFVHEIIVIIILTIIGGLVGKITADLYELAKQKINRRWKKKDAEDAKDLLNQK
jgi:uncharacterized membrane protein